MDVSSDTCAWRSLCQGPLTLIESLNGASIACGKWCYCIPPWGLCQ